MTALSEATRRAVLMGGGFSIAVALAPRARAANRRAVEHELGAFIDVSPDDVVTFVAPTPELGHGAYTAGAQIIAEELCYPYARIRVAAAPPDESLYANPLLQMQLAGDSSGIRGFYDPLRRAGATARTRIVAAAARRWGVRAEDCEARDGVVRHAASRRSATFGELAGAAMDEPEPQTVHYRSPSDYTVIGASVPRLDLADKATGRAVYGIDVVRPGMKFAAVYSSPVIGGRLMHVDPAPALAVGGVRAVLTRPDAIAVVGDTSWAALKGLNLLDPDWGPADATSTPALRADLVTASRTTKPLISQGDGQIDEALKRAPHHLVTEYELPFLAHVPMEPLNCVVELGPESCDVWLGTQSVTRVQHAAAQAAGLRQDQVRVHNQLTGGGFGRRSYADYVPFAVEIARRIDAPVKMIWPREQEFRGGMFRPMFHQRVEVGIDDAGDPQGWSHTITGGSVLARFLPEMAARGTPDTDAIEGADELVYKVGPTHLEYVRHDPPIPVGWWRSVGPGHNIFVIEGVIDQLAERAGVDPLAYRRRLLAEGSRERRVLDLAAAKGNWGAPMAPRSGRGVALQYAFGSYLACVIEAAVSESGDVSLHRVVAAVDCGRAINPRNVASQVEGAMIFGLSAALWGEVTVTGGRIDQSNFNDYRVLRLDETPPMEVHLVDSHAAPGGIGEAGTSIVAPALASAIFQASGKRLRSLPVSRHGALLSERKGWLPGLVGAAAGLSAAIGHATDAAERSGDPSAAI